MVRSRAYRAVGQPGERTSKPDEVYQRENAKLFDVVYDTIDLASDWEMIDITDLHRAELTQELDE